MILTLFLEINLSLALNCWTLKAHGLISHSPILIASDVGLCRQLISLL